MKYVLILGLRFQKNCVYHPMLFERVRVAANIDCDKYIVSGNDVEGCGITVADKMKNILVKCFHKDEENVILEPKAMSTIQNLYYSCRLIPPGSKVIVVTSSFHMPRVRLLLQNFSNVSFVESPNRYRDEKEKKIFEFHEKRSYNFVKKNYK